MKGHKEPSETTDHMTEPVSTRVVEVVSRAKDVDPVELPPLYEAVDPDALDLLFPGGTDCELRFTYVGQDVIVRNGGEIVVRKDGEAVARRGASTGMSA